MTLIFTYLPDPTNPLRLEATGKAASSAQIATIMGNANKSLAISGTAVMSKTINTLNILNIQTHLSFWRATQEGKWLEFYENDRVFAGARIENSTAIISLAFLDQELRDEFRLKFGV